MVDIASLPNYTPGDENSVTVPPAGDAAVTADAGVDAPVEPPGAPAGVMADPIVVAYVVTTLAGSGAPAFADGAGTGASFNRPAGVAVDAAGNVYVADSGNHRIRKVTHAGVVTTMAGSGTPGFADGTGANASFNFPNDVAVDAAGNVYVPAFSEYRIRKVTPAGVVTTLAGSGAVANVDGTGGAASFEGPRSVATDVAGNVYVGDGDRIRKVTPTGIVTTLAGRGSPGFSDGRGTGAGFSGPNGLVVDAEGNIYVADTQNRRVRKVTSAGVVTTLAGSTDGRACGPNPAGITLAAAAGALYISDSADQRIRKVTLAGVATTVAGDAPGFFQDGTGAGARFNTPTGIAISPTGTFYVADRENHRVRKVTPVGVGQLAVTWSAPSTTGSAITGYVASAGATGHSTRTCSAPGGASSCTISGLVSDVAYSVVVTASNAGGPGAPSAPTPATPN